MGGNRVPLHDGPGLVVVRALYDSTFRGNHLGPGSQVAIFNQLAAAAVDFSLETSNSTLLFQAQAFQMELALREGQLAVAEQWADQFEGIPPLSAMVQLYQPHLTLVKIWLAQDTLESRGRAAELLGLMKQYTDSTHNRFFSIEVLLLLALLHSAEDDETAALARLETALQLANPGGIILPFLDLGPPMANLLRRLRGRGISPEYLGQFIDQILTVFDESAADQHQLRTDGSSSQGLDLVDLLTSREMEVLELLAQRLTNREIAKELTVAVSTVKSHTLSIYAKLDVQGRRQAVDKAREFGLLSPK